MISAQDVKARWESIQNDDERILFVVGGPGSGKSRIIRELAEQRGWKYMEAKHLIDADFLEVPREERPALAEESIRRALNMNIVEVALVDGINVLFAPILNLEPIELLRKLSTTIPIVVGWRGHLEGNTLYLEHNGNTKYAFFEVQNLNHIITIDE